MEIRWLAYVKCSMILPTPQFGHFVEITSIRTKVNDFRANVNRTLRRHNQIHLHKAKKQKKKNNQRISILRSVLQVPNAQVENARPKWASHERDENCFAISVSIFANELTSICICIFEISKCSALIDIYIYLKIEQFRQQNASVDRNKSTNHTEMVRYFWGPWLLQPTCKCKMHSES